MTAQYVVAFYSSAPLLLLLLLFVCVFIFGTDYDELVYRFRKMISDANC